MIPEEIARRERLKNLREAGVEPYPIGSSRTHMAKEVIDTFSTLETTKEKLTVSGRLRAIRKHGGVTFCVLEDQSGKIQLMMHRDHIGIDTYNGFHDLYDIGDIVEGQGTAIKTKKGEMSVALDSIKMLTKTLLPLPEKWHGLTDVEKRYRKRYLDLIANPEAKTKIALRSKIIHAMRDLFHQEGYMEVETPILKHKLAAQKHDHSKHTTTPSMPTSISASLQNFSSNAAWWEDLNVFLNSLDASETKASASNTTQSSPKWKSTPLTPTETKCLTTSNDSLRIS